MPARRQILALIFLSTAIGGWIWLLAPAYNYFHYFSSLSQLTVTIDGVKDASYPSNVTVTLAFHVNNPIQYVGLTFEIITYTATLSNSTSSIDFPSETAGVNGNAPIPPNSTLNVPASFVLTGPTKNQFLEMCTSGNGTLSWTFTGTLLFKARDEEVQDQFDQPAMSSC